MAIKPKYSWKVTYKFKLNPESKECFFQIEFCAKEFVMQLEKNKFVEWVKGEAI